MSEFEAKPAFITGRGGSRLAAMRLLAQRGAQVVFLGQEAGLGDTAMAGLRADGFAAMALVADEAAIASAFTAFDVVHHRPSVPATSEGIQSWVAVETTRPDTWNPVLAVNLGGVNLGGVCLGRKFPVPGMRAGGGGSVVQVAPVQAGATQTRAAASFRAPDAPAAQTPAMAPDHAPDSIRVNTCIPGCIDAPITHLSAREPAANGEEQALMPLWGLAQPIGRVASPKRRQR